MMRELSFQKCAPKDVKMKNSSFSKQSEFKKNYVEQQKTRVPKHNLKEFLATKFLKKPLIPRVGNVKPLSRMKSNSAAANIEDFVEKVRKKNNEALELCTTDDENKKKKLTTFETDGFSQDDFTNALTTVDEYKHIGDSIGIKTKEGRFNLGFQINNGNNNDIQHHGVFQEHHALNSRNENTIHEKKNSVLDETGPRLKTLDEMSANGLINLETGFIEHRKMGGPNLFQRLKNVEKTIALKVQGFEETQNDILEKQNPFQNKLSSEMLKNSLRNLMLRKRLEKVKPMNLKVEPTLYPDTSSLNSATNKRELVRRDMLQIEGTLEEENIINWEISSSRDQLEKVIH